MEITRRRREGDEAEIELRGRLDAYWADHLSQDLDQLVRGGAHRLWLDLSGVTYLSSLGIGLLVRFQKEHRRAALIGRVFQNPFSGTAPNMTIAENLALAARRSRRRGWDWALGPTLKAEIRDRIRQLNMGLEDRLDNAIGTLSGGHGRP